MLLPSDGSPAWPPHRDRRGAWPSAPNWFRRSIGVLAWLALVPARSEASEPTLWPVPRDPRGTLYIDATGHRRILGPFARAAVFSEGVARASTLGGSYGYLDSHGAWRIRPQFEDARDYHEGLAAVALRGAGDPYTMPAPWGFIDATGKHAIALRFGNALDFSEGRAAVTSRVDGAKWGFIDRTGVLIIAPQYDDVGNFIDGLARATTVAQDGSHVEGFIGREGRWAIAPRFREVHDFAEGLAAVSTDGKSCGYLDDAGNVAIAARFARCGAFREGLASVRTVAGAAFINRRGEVVLAGQFRDAGDFNGGMAPVAARKGQWRFVDRAGHTVFEFARSQANPKQRLPLTAAHAFDGPLALVWSGQGSARTTLWVNRKGLIIWQFHQRALGPPPGLQAPPEP